MEAAVESALVILVPEAEALVAPFRARHDPSAAEGIAAHVTLLYPFRHPARIDAAVLKTLVQCFAARPAFAFVLAEAKILAGEVLYLAPRPAEPFRDLILALAERFPDTPPYGGRHADIVPHLTVAQIADTAALARVAAGLAAAAAGRLPAAARAEEVALLDNAAGHWAVRDRFALAPRKQPGVPYPARAGLPTAIE